ncbi:MAG TPA: polysaccharide deacetylase family protein, partial [Ktedonobacterales bacterium]|nr:polysaccharide deacetylase family protein [Ktedonobacterales bacterium]
MAHGDVPRKKKTTRRLPRWERRWGGGAYRRVALSVFLALGLMLLAASGAAYASAGSTLTALGMAPWSGPATPGSLGTSSGPHGIGSPLPTATRTPAPTATPRPRPPATNRQLNDMMGCHYGAPAPLPAVVYSGGYATGRAPAEVALTFDDGPSPSSTVPILSYLERTRTAATFMVIGNQVASSPDLVRREWRDGFAIGVHTWDHPDMTKLTAKQVQNELDSTLNALHNALGADACIWFW